MDYCYNFLDRNATEVLQHDSFLQLSVVRISQFTYFWISCHGMGKLYFKLFDYQEALQGLLERDSFFAPEVDIFKAVCSWFSANQLWVKSEGGQAQVVSL